jgi:hypothetical protein
VLHAPCPHSLPLLGPSAPLDTPTIPLRQLPPLLCSTGAASMHDWHGELTTSAWGGVGVAGRRVGIGHGEWAAIIGTAGSERVRPSRRAAQRVAAVADMGCGERAPPSRRTARRTCAAGVASSRPPLCVSQLVRRAAWRAGGRRGHMAW